MRATGSTMISRDSIVYPTMEGGSKGKIKEGSPRRSPGGRRCLSQSSYSDVPAASRASAFISEPLAVHDLAIRKPPTPARR